VCWACRDERRGGPMVERGGWVGKAGPWLAACGGAGSRRCLCAPTLVRLWDTVAWGYLVMLVRVETVGLGCVRP